MKIDLYTKTVLTVIALALSIIALKNIEIIPTANAAKETSGTAFKNNMFQSTMDVRVVGWSTYDEVKTKITDWATYDEIPVQIKNTNSLPVNLKEVSGSSIWSSGIPVDIKAVNGTSLINKTLPVTEHK